MSLLRRIFGRSPAPAREQRNMGAFGNFGFGPISTGAGYLVNATLAQNLSGVTACVNLIAGTISTLPATVFRSVANGREAAPTHPVAGLIRRPNARQTWPDFIAMQMAQVLLYGNALARIEYDDAGKVTALIPVPWPFVQVQLLPSGRLVFDVMAFVAPWGGTGLPRRLLEDEVFLLKDRSDDGYLGRSAISRAPMVLQSALGLQTYSAAIWENAATPSGVLKHPMTLTPEAKEYISSGFAKLFAGAANAKKIPVLEEGMTFEAMAVSPEDAEVLASRRFTGEEIARLFGVPPPLIGDLQFGSFTNTETAGRFFAKFCLSVWVTRIEAEFQRSVFNDDAYHMMIDLAGLQRGDDAARWASYAIAIDKGILTKNEIREIEGFNPLPDPAEIVPGAGAP